MENVSSAPAQAVENTEKVQEEQKVDLASKDGQLDGKAQENKVEEKKVDGAEEGKEAEKYDKIYSSKFAALSRREKALKSKERELADKEKRIQELEAKEKQAAEGKGAQKEEVPLDYKLKRDPLNTLKEVGLDLDTLIQIALQDGKLSPEMQLKLMKDDIEKGYKSELEEIKKELQAEKEAKRKQQEEEEKARHAATIQSFKDEIKAEISAKKEDYELINTEEAYDLVYDVIESHYNATKEENGDEGATILSIEEAAKQVEEFLADELAKRLETSKAKKIAESKLQIKKQDTQEKKVSPTLTNEQSTASKANSTGHTLSKDEELERNASLIRWVQE